MMKFTYKLTVRQRVMAKCVRHPRYNPEKESRAGIRGGCSACWNLYDLHQARLRLDAAIHEFERKAAPWAILPKPRKSAITTANTTAERIDEQRPTPAAREY